MGFTFKADNKVQFVTTTGYPRKKKIRLSVVLVILLLSGILSYEFLWGKLFAYSPVFIGFSKHELPKTVIYIQNGADYRDYVRIDTLIAGVEKFHEWKFLFKPKIFVFTDRESYLKRSLSNARFVTYYNGNIFISPWALSEAMANKISLEIYLRHELSHALIHQHAGIIHAVQYPKWLMEGIAMYSANQMGTSLYPDKKETYALMNKGYFMSPDYFRTRNERKTKLDLKNSATFLYSEFACVVDYLVATYGKEKLMLFTKALSANPDNNKVFKEVYGVDFLQVMNDFKKHVNSEKL